LIDGAFATLLHAEAMFHGYAWSLDTFVDYAWQDLTRLSVTIIALLIVEVSIWTCFARRSVVELYYY
jgi:hypothetical protein